MAELRRLFAAVLLFCCLAGNQVLAAPPSTERGDLVYLLDSSKGTSLQVSSASGTPKLNVLLTQAPDFFKQIAVSPDRKHVFLTVDYEKDSYENPKSRSDLLVVSLTTAEVVGRFRVPGLSKGSLKTCTLRGPAPVAVGKKSASSGLYPVYVGATCTGGCKSKLPADETQPVASSTFVLSLRYNPKTNKLTNVGSIRTGFTDVCTKEIVQTLRTLWVPPSGLPLMIIGERDATTFHLRPVKPGSRNVLTWKSGHSGECNNFVIGGTSEFYALCPGRFTGLYASGTIKRIRSSPQPRVTSVGASPSKPGVRFYNFGIATLPGSQNPFYAVAAAPGPDDDKLTAFDKTRLGSKGRFAFSLTKHGSHGRVFNIAVLP